ncbi:hypothetical protein PTSG_02539 [Salpingoeca rosetta]|uniref:Uncharacterized protein n=1 Tax=Salpingoeca rosetta (strain ATCC 50818 / BSB-021) TaxID=946362 RepID=F2U2H3_SALR5|nr:uncharacterized protein PTSG_02539 [Salpingoeca rosetta]EGD81825.1 hypothetical protein PTSG_02539 [Salpingoeca rosetta]|eukprot:XP_004997029.1 hypothetical protein PTSG_02539 [Salpingoeca rosetta]
MVYGRRARPRVYLGEDNDDDDYDDDEEDQEDTEQVVNEQWGAQQQLRPQNQQQQQQQQQQHAVDSARRAAGTHNGENDEDDGEGDDDDIDDAMLLELTTTIEASQSVVHRDDAKRGGTATEGGDPEPKAPKMSTAEAGRHHHIQGQHAAQANPPLSSQRHLSPTSGVTPELKQSLAKARGEAATLRFANDKLEQENRRLVQDRADLQKELKVQIHNLQEQYAKEKKALESKIKFLQMEIDNSKLDQEASRAPRKQRITPAEMGDIAVGFTSPRRPQQHHHHYHRQQSSGGDTTPPAAEEPLSEVQATPLKPARRRPAVSSRGQQTDSDATATSSTARGGSGDDDGGGGDDGADAWQVPVMPMHVFPRNSTIDTPDLSKNVFFVEGVVSSDFRAQEWLSSLADPNDNRERALLLSTLATLVTRRPVFLASICHDPPTTPSSPSTPSPSRIATAAITGAAVPVEPGSHRSALAVVLHMITAETADARVCLAAVQCLKTFAIHCHPTQGSVFHDLFRPHVLDTLQAACTDNVSMMAETVELFSHIYGLAPMQSCGIPPWVLAAACADDTRVSFDAKVRLSSALATKDDADHETVTKLAHALFKHVEEFLFRIHTEPARVDSCWRCVMRALKSPAAQRWSKHITKVSDTTTALIIASNNLRIAVALMRAFKSLAASHPSLVASEDCAHAVQLTYESAHRAAASVSRRQRRPSRHTRARTHAKAAAAAAAAAS